MDDFERLDVDNMYYPTHEETYQRGQVVFEEGSSGDWVYIILSGEVEVSRTVDGKKYILGRLEKGEVFGELAFLGDSKRSATVISIAETTVGLVDREFLDTEFNKISSDIRSLLISMVQRYKKMLGRVKDYSSRKEERVIKRLALKFNDRQSFVNAYTSDLSGGGLFIKTENPLAVGEQFVLKLQLPGLPKPMQIKSEVVWARKKPEESGRKPAGMGIKLSDLTEQNIQIIKRYLKGSKK